MDYAGFTGAAVMCVPDVDQLLINSATRKDLHYQLFILAGSERCPVVLWQTEKIKSYEEGSTLRGQGVHMGDCFLCHDPSVGPVPSSYAHHLDLQSFYTYGAFGEEELIHLGALFQFKIR